MHVWTGVPENGAMRVCAGVVQGQGEACEDGGAEGMCAAPPTFDAMGALCACAVCLGAEEGGCACRCNTAQVPPRYTSHHPPHCTIPLPGDALDPKRGRAGGAPLSGAIAGSARRVTSGLPQRLDRWAGSVVADALVRRRADGHPVWEGEQEDLWEVSESSRAGRTFHMRGGERRGRARLRGEDGVRWSELDGVPLKGGCAQRYQLRAHN